MKKHLSLSAIILALGVFLFAQEKIEVSMKVIKDGKVVKDTTYAFEDSKKAKHAVHTFDAMASGEHHMEYIHKDENVKVIVQDLSDGDCDGNHKKVIKKKIIMISDEDGDDGTWTIKEGEDGKDIMYKKIEGEDGEVIIIKKIKGEGDEEEIMVEVIIKEELEKKAVKKEKIKKEVKKKSKK